MDCSDGLIERQVAHTLRARIRDDANWHVRRVQERSSHGGCIVLAAAPEPGAMPEIAVKVFRRTELAAAEHRAGRLLSALRLRVAEPLLLDEPAGLVAARWVGGPTLGEALLSPVPDTGCLGPALTAAGRWLRRLHDRSIRLRPVLRRRLVPLGQICEHVSGLPAALPPEARDAFLAAADAVAARVADQLAPRPERPVTVHGDFVPQNLVLTPRAPTAIDISGLREGFREDDLTRMTAELMIVAQEPRGRGRFCPDHARSAFLSGYRLSDPGERARLEAWEEVEMLRRWRHFLDPANWAACRTKAEAARAALARRGLAA